MIETGFRTTLNLDFKRNTRAPVVGTRLKNKTLGDLCKNSLLTKFDA